jgi:curli production assembly/transport component CsgG/holdfast attachment protein HfaB
VGVGGRAQEPIQLAIRSVVERAVLEMMANLYAVPSGDVCAQTAGAISTNSVTGDFVPRGAPLEEYNGPSREVASNWHSKRDTSLRGRN